MRVSLLLSLLLLSLCSSAFYDLTISKMGYAAVFLGESTIYVDDDNTLGPWYGTPAYPYQNITSALDHALENDTIYVHSGTYPENLLVNKTISLVGQNRTNTQIVGLGDNNVAPGLRVANVDAVNVTGFSIVDIAYSSSTVIMNSSNINIINCVIHGWGERAHLFSAVVQDSLNVTFENCEIGSLYDDENSALLLANSDNNIVHDCTLIGASPAALTLRDSNSNTIFANYIQTFMSWWITYKEAINMRNSHNNTFYRNDINALAPTPDYNLALMVIDNCSFNLFYHNNMSTSSGYPHSFPPAITNSALNQWDNGYPSGGNYWEDYTGSNLFSGPFQNITGSDGLGDTPYIIDSNNTDHYPLMTLCGPPVARFMHSPSEPWVGATVLFNASGSYDYDGSILNYTWDFGDETTLNDTDPVANHVYKSEGVYTVVLNTTDDDGRRDAVTAQVTVSPSPIACFTYEPAEPVINETVAFDASMSYDINGTIITYEWSFGDGNVTSTFGPSVNHAYSTVGTYNVTLTVIDNAGLNDTISSLIIVGKLSSQISISAFPISVTIGENTTISGSIMPTRAGANVTIWHRMSGVEVWSILTNVTTDGNSGYSHLWIPPQPGTFELKADWTGDEHTHPAESSTTLFCMQVTTSISISTSCASTYVGFRVNITGTLQDMYGTFLRDKTVVLYYTFSGIGTWTPITSDTTDVQGKYQATWIPPATGYFILKAEWAGNTTHAQVNSTTTISSVDYNNQYVFSVESNSTISELAFNTTDWTLSFTAIGPDDTSGYVKVTVAQSLIADIGSLHVYLDDIETEYSIMSMEDSWLLTFEYTHSTHHIVMDLNVNIIPELLHLNLALLSMLLTLLAAIAYKRRKRKPFSKISPKRFVDYLLSEFSIS